MIVVPESHQQGHLSIENEDMIQQILHDHTIDFGLQVSRDGRVWVCLNGVAWLRFKPKA